MNAIQIKNITKRYKDVTALDDISFSFEFGRIYVVKTNNQVDIYKLWVVYTGFFLFRFYE